MILCVYVSNKDLFYGFVIINTWKITVIWVTYDFEIFLLTLW